MGLKVGKSFLTTSYSTLLFPISQNFITLLYHLWDLEQTENFAPVRQIDIDGGSVEHDNRWEERMFVVRSFFLSVLIHFLSE